MIHTPKRTGLLSFLLPSGRQKPLLNGIDLTLTLIILILASLIGEIFALLGFSDPNTVTILILGVLLISVVTSHREYGLFASVASVAIYSYFFAEPRFSFKVVGLNSAVTLAVTFLSAFLTSSFAAKIKERLYAASRTAYRTNVLLETNQLLQKESDRSGLLRLTAAQLNKLLRRDTLCCEPGEHGLLPPVVFRESTDPDLPRGPSPDTLEERAAARRAFLGNCRTGPTTEILSGVSFLYLPVSGSESYGVIGIRLGSEPPDAFETNLIQSILWQCILSLDQESLSRKRREEEARVRTEQLRSALLRSISHDLRTPLTSISGNAALLLGQSGPLPPDRQKQLCQDIYDDAVWLIQLIENLLSITRMEGGDIRLHMEGELLEEVVTEALRHVSRDARDHVIQVASQEDFLMARMDSRLILQVIINLVNNAVKYTPKGSHIWISWKRQGGFAAVEISDDGPGILPQHRDKIFEMFYTADSPSGDSRRGMGLGLALCRSIIQAHGGDISLKDRKPHGCIFTFTLPIEEVHLHDESTHSDRRR